MNKTIKILVLLIAFIGVYSCSQKQEPAPQTQQEYADDRISPDMQRTLTDTVSVLSHVRAYLDMLQRNEVDSALSFVYVADGDSVAPLMGAAREALRQQVTTFPVLSYEIDKLQMFNSQDTRVHYTIKYFEKTEDNPLQNTLQCVIGLRRVGYMWYLIAPTETRDLVEFAY